MEQPGGLGAHQVGRELAERRNGSPARTRRSAPSCRSPRGTTGRRRVPGPAARARPVALDPRGGSRPARRSAGRGSAPRRRGGNPRGQRVSYVTPSRPLQSPDLGLHRAPTAASSGPAPAAPVDRRQLGRQPPIGTGARDDAPQRGSAAAVPRRARAGRAARGRGRAGELTTASIRRRFATATRSLRAAPTHRDVVLLHGRRRQRVDRRRCRQAAVLRPPSPPACTGRSSARSRHRRRVRGTPAGRASATRRAGGRCAARRSRRPRPRRSRGSRRRAPRARRGSCRTTRPGRPAAPSGCRSPRASSASATRSAWAWVSRAAPCTCGLQRIEYASCTRGSSSRWLATIAEPSSSRRRFAALSAWPGWGRNAIRSSAKARSVPRSASVAGRRRRRLTQLREVGQREDEHPEDAVGAVDQREALLRAEHRRLDPGGGERLARGGRRAFGASTSPSPIIASAQ